MTAAERMQRPLAEVDPEVYQAIQHETERHESVDGADTDPGEEELEKEVHAGASAALRSGRLK